jgi:hypothetical protein
MDARRRSALSLASLLALGALACGCGSGPGDGAAAGGTGTIDLPTERMAGADAQAKADVRNAVSQMEVCFTERQTYSSCPPDLHAPRVSATGTPTGYAVTARSSSGNAFVMSRSQDGSVKRTCRSAGRAGCPSTGTW